MTRHSCTALTLLLMAGVLAAGASPARAQTPQPPAQEPAQPPAQEPTITAATPQADDDARLRPVEPDFSIVNLPTTLPLPVHAANFHLTHRFNDNLIAKGTDFGDHLSGLFGLDSGANIGLEFRYGVMRHLQAIVQRTSISKTIQFSGKYDGWRQSATLPVSISAIVSVEGDNNFRQHYSPALGAVISRTFDERVALYAMPMWVHNTPASFQGNRDTGLLGLGGRLRVLSTTSIIAEVLPRIGGYVLRNPEFGFGIEKRVGAHVFALTFTNTPTTTYRQMALGGNPNTLNLGFNLTRKFY